MTDPRLCKLARTLLHHSTALQSGERILIEAIDVPEAMTCELVRLAGEIGAAPLVLLKNNRIERALRRQATAAQMKLIGEVEALAMRSVDAYVGLRGSHNISELSDVPAEQQEHYVRHVWQKVHLQIRCLQTRWVILRWPHPAMAQQAAMSTEAFEKFFFDVCTLDYGRMARAMEPLVARFSRTERIRILGPDTDLRFSVAGLTGVACSGKANLPDGEVFTAPVRDSVQGRVRFTARALGDDGVSHDEVRFEFNDGKIIQATSSNSERLNRILDRDEGARYLGEFALGVNPYITRPMLDPLFDEKIAGSFHLAAGAAIQEIPAADNGNRSMVHWDLVCLQDPESGGGEIWFDDQLVRKDGVFLPEDLLPLNPENLI